MYYVHNLRKLSILTKPILIVAYISKYNILTNPLPYHILNNFIFLVNVCLIYYLFNTIFIFTYFVTKSNVDNDFNHIFNVCSVLN